MCESRDIEKIEYAWQVCGKTCYDCSLKNVPKCVDLRSNCALLPGICEELPDYVQTMCRRTCKLCNDTE
ncbi:shTK domain protein [Oesophagostomum dentatum]|uniref:ShTK domain protein n=1 Tax=Oesophagostomum dentatum TaxID=61180 RepID=A0A0B1SCC1_OESDE|nr:shTK domain protein [Oesophagostomum dentatum]